MISRRIIVPVMAAVAVAAVLAGVSQFGCAPGTAAARAGEDAAARAQLPRHAVAGYDSADATGVHDHQHAGHSDRDLGQARGIGHRAAAWRRQPPCSLSTGGWPAVRLDLASGATPVAKAYPCRPALTGSFTP